MSALALAKITYPMTVDQCFLTRGPLNTVEYLQELFLKEMHVYVVFLYSNLVLENPGSYIRP